MNSVMMVSNRTCTLRTLYGSVQFIKDTPRKVSPHMVPEALAIGVLPVDTDKPIFEEEPEKQVINAQTRKQLVIEAVEDIYRWNDPDHFTAGASPKRSVVEHTAGITKLSAKELADVINDRNQRLHDADMERRLEAAKPAETAKPKKTKATVPPEALDAAKAALPPEEDEPE